MPDRRTAQLRLDKQAKTLNAQTTETHMHNPARLLNTIIFSFLFPLPSPIAAYSTEVYPSSLPSLLKYP
jgi:hypothetical protein